MDAPDKYLGCVGSCAQLHSIRIFTIVKEPLEQMIWNKFESK